MHDLPPSDDQHWLPATFRERGVAVPFTSPTLAGARVRLMERRCDLVVPHPGGARGVYIFSLASLTEFCAPTLHDLRLAERLSALATLTPAGVREAARIVAAEGAGGRSAAAAAAASARTDNHLRSMFEAVLLGRSIRGGSVQACVDEVAQRTRQAVLQLAARTGRSPEAVKTDIELLASHLVDAGLDLPGGTSGRCTALLDAIGLLAQETRAWMVSTGEQPAGGQVADAAEAMVTAGRLVLAAAQKPVQDPATLLSAWAAAPEPLANRIGRPALLLDGWEHLCLLWRVAETDDARAEAVAEASVLLPPIPSEVDAWFATMPSLQGRLRSRGTAGPMPRAHGRVPSQAVALVERNERILALAA